MCRRRNFIDGLKQNHVEKMLPGKGIDIRARIRAQGLSVAMFGVHGLAGSNILKSIGIV